MLSRYGITTGAIAVLKLNTRKRKLCFPEDDETIRFTFSFQNKWWLSYKPLSRCRGGQNDNSGAFHTKRCQSVRKSPRHVVAWPRKPSCRIQIRQWVWHRGMLFVFMPLPSGSFRSTTSMFADSLQCTWPGCCSASLRFDWGYGISERQAQKMKGLP